jgi:acyl carrier protein
MVAALADYIVKEVTSRAPDAPLTADFPIIEGGLVDSLGLFKLISFIEERYSVRIRPEDILLENFATLGAVVRLIEANRS